MISSWVIITTFLSTSIIPPDIAQAQILPSISGFSSFNAFNLPQPVSMLATTPAYTPAIVRGMTIFPDKPLQFDFIMDVGDDHLGGDEFKKEADKLAKYFMIFPCFTSFDLHTF